MILVVDASVVAPCFAPERLSEAARGWLDAADALLAPDARSALKRIVSGFIELRSSTVRASTAFELGTELNHPVYDCAYIALAEAEGAAFLSADRRLVELVLANRPRLHAHWVAQEIPRAH